MASATALLQLPEAEDFASETSFVDTAGEDTPVAPYEDLTVIQAIRAYKHESEEARQTREELNKINYDAANCRQMGPPKAHGQSQEFLPKTPMALEQLGAFIQRGLLAFGDWFSTELTPDPAFLPPPTLPTPQGPVPLPPPPMLTASGIRKLMRHRLESPDQIPPGCTDFPTTLADGVKHAALGALLILKVHGQWVPARKLRIVPGPPIPQVRVDPVTGIPGLSMAPGPEQLTYEEGQVWRLLVELVRTEDYYPDPTGRGLYEIHKTYRDLHEIIALAEPPEGQEPWYDPQAVAALAASLNSEDGQESDHGEATFEEMTDQDQTTRPAFRKEVELLEFWGTLLDSAGNAVARNVCAIVANDHFLIKKPYPNPHWHQESPFVVGSLLRVPFSVFHKALFDNAVRLNLAMNELFNLIVDGGISSVWGIRWFKPDAIENADQLSEGIPQGVTLVVKRDVPDGEMVAGHIRGGEVPPDAMATYQLLDREYAAATMISDTARGQTPRKDVSATAVASADQSTAVFFDAIIGNLEQTIVTKALRLAWLTMLQNCDDWLADDVAGCIGPQTAQMLAAMSPARRYALYAQGARFKAHGLSSMIARTRDFQKIMAALGAISQSPVLMQAFMLKYSPDKCLGHILKSLNIDPEDWQMTEEELQTMQDRLQQLPLFAGMAGGGQGMQQSQMGMEQQPGSPTQQVQADINQQQQVPEGL